MKDFFELLVRKFHLPEFIASYTMLTFYCISGLLICYKFIKALYQGIVKRGIKKVINNDLHPYFTYDEIYKYTKYYVPQHYQNITPSEGEELGGIHAAAAKSKLMPEFIKKGLLTKSSKKYFIILSDTGMGKTAFLINLYKKYKTLKNKPNRIKYEIYYFPLGSKDSLKRIKLLTNKSHSILLLDAFDEDIKAVHDYKNRMIEILEEVKDFRKVIFTCRTQFFPSKDEEPSDTNDITFGENIKHSIHKLYLSAFDNKDILMYLLKKYDLNFIRLHKAYKIVKKSPSLMFRPMLLSYIDDLIDSHSRYTYTYEIYQVLINKWIEREAKKPAILSRENSWYYSKNLMLFSRSLAVNLYNERDKRQGYFITVDELKKITIHSSIDPNDLTIDDKTGRSLLNRNSIGQFKFSHKSILEYLLAVELFKEPRQIKGFDFTGMDATKSFFSEMLANLLTNFDGLIYFENDNKSKSPSIISVSQIAKIESLCVYNCVGKEFNNFAGFPNLKLLVFTDPSFESLYYLYLCVIIEKRVKHTQTNINYKRTYETFVTEYIDIINILKGRPTILGFHDLKLLIENSNIPDTNKRLFLNLLANEEINQPLSTEEISDLKELRGNISEGKSERAFIISAYDTFLKINRLAHEMPSIKIIY